MPVHEAQGAIDLALCFHGQKFGFGVLILSIHRFPTAPTARFLNGREAVETVGDTVMSRHEREDSPGGDGHYTF
jgi:hypothetical protein